MKAVFFSGRRGSPLQDADEGAPYSQTDRNEDVDGFGLRYINAKILQATPASIEADSKP